MEEEILFFQVSYPQPPQLEGVRGINLPIFFQKESVYIVGVRSDSQCPFPASHLAIARHIGRLLEEGAYHPSPSVTELTVSKGQQDLPTSAPSLTRDSYLTWTTFPALPEGVRPPMDLDPFSCLTIDPLQFCRDTPVTTFYTTDPTDDVIHKFHKLERSVT